MRASPVMTEKRGSPSRPRKELSYIDSKNRRKFEYMRASTPDNHMVYKGHKRINKYFDPNFKQK